jgi:hypothetical protein
MALPLADAADWIDPGWALTVSFANSTSGLSLVSHISWEFYSWEYLATDASGYHVYVGEDRMGRLITRAGLRYSGRSSTRAVAAASFDLEGGLAWNWRDSDYLPEKREADGPDFVLVSSVNIRLWPNRPVFPDAGVALITFPQDWGEDFLAMHALITVGVSFAI